MFGRLLVGIDGRRSLDAFEDRATGGKASKSNASIAAISGRN
jgi:hypothetical protein